MAIETLPEPSIPITTPFRPGLGFLTSTPIIAAATVCLALVILSAIFAPWLTPHDPQLLAPALRLKPASAEYLLGTDAYGRDVLARILYGGRISLLIGLGAAVVSVAVGLVIGLVSGFFRWVDAVMMRVMDGLMAIPSILLAIAVVSLSGASNCGSCGVSHGAKMAERTTSVRQTVAAAMIGVAVRNPSPGRNGVVIGIEGSGRVSIAISILSWDRAGCRRRRSED